MMFFAWKQEFFPLLNRDMPKFWGFLNWTNANNQSLATTMLATTMLASTKDHLVQNVSTMKNEDEQANFKLMNDEYNSPKGHPQIYSR
jgi:hypothetical protein